MGLMTFFTLGGHHIWAVRLMALRALGNLAVNIVAETASQVCVPALDLLQLDDLLSVACQTFIGNIICQLDYLGGVGIIVAA
jgi:hypothetical protein